MKYCFKGIVIENQTAAEEGTENAEDVCKCFGDAEQDGHCSEWMRLCKEAQKDP